eukprot:1140250-Pelagomonas_calceolata.AAC.10
MVHKYPCDGRNAGWPGFYQAIYKLTPAIIDGQSCYCNRVFLLPEALRQDQEVNSRYCFDFYPVLKSGGESKEVKVRHTLEQAHVHTNTHARSKKHECLTHDALTYDLSFAHDRVIDI